MKIGDVVRLRSGGPRSTVTDEVEGKLEVSWASEQGEGVLVVPAAALVLVEPVEEVRTLEVIRSLILDSGTVHVPDACGDVPPEAATLLLVQALVRRVKALSSVLPKDPVPTPVPRNTEPPRLSISGQGYYKLLYPAGSPFPPEPTSCMVTERGDVWGFSLYEGIARYRTLGMNLHAHLQETRARMVPDFNRLGNVSMPPPGCCAQRDKEGRWYYTDLPPRLHIGMVVVRESGRWQVTQEPATYFNNTLWVEDAEGYVLWRKDP